MTFGQIIKNLRRKTDMTQERLAEILGISGQAVSRWENDLAMPDISLLPVLANLFDVTTDYLLGVDISRKDKHIQEILKSAMERGKTGHHADAADIIRAGLKEYPNNYRLMYWLMFHVHFGANAQKKEDQRPALEEAISLGEQILEKCTDDDIRHQTIGRLCACYASLGEQNKMKQLAETMPNLWESRDRLLALYTRGEEQLTAKRRDVCSLLSAAAINLSQLHFRHDTRSTWKELSHGDIMAAQKNALSMIDMLCPDGDYGSLELTRMHAYHIMADLCFEAADWEEGLDYLEKAVAIAIYLDTDYDSTKTHTSPLFCGQVYGNIIYSSVETACYFLLSNIKKEHYCESLLQTEKGRSLIARLESHTQKRD